LRWCYRATCAAQLAADAVRLHGRWTASSFASNDSSYMNGIELFAGGGVAQV
jgi:hypothetical protein